MKIDIPSKNGLFKKGKNQVYPLSALRITDIANPEKIRIVLLKENGSALTSGLILPKETMDRLAKEWLKHSENLPTE
jgi:hypothetical protein